MAVCHGSLGSLGSGSLRVWGPSHGGRGGHGSLKSNDSFAGCRLGVACVAMVALRAQGQWTPPKRRSLKGTKLTKQLGKAAAVKGENGQAGFLDLSECF